MLINMLLGLELIVLSGSLVGILYSIKVPKKEE